MKRISMLVFVVAFVLVGCVAGPAVAPTNGLAQNLVALPEEGRILVLSLVTAAVTWLLLQIAAVLKLDLSGYVQPIVAIISPILVTIIESFLQTIPPAMDNITLTIIHLIVLFVGSLGSFMIFKRASAPKTLLAG